MSVSKAKVLSDKLWERYEKEKRYYQGDVDPLLKDAAEELQSLESKCKDLSDAWARAEQRISVLLQDKVNLANTTSVYRKALNDVFHTCGDILAND